MTLDLAIGILGLLLALACLGALLARFGWPFELFTHFRAHYALAGVCLGVICALRNDWPPAAANMCIALWALVGMITPRRLRVARADISAPGLTIVWANIWKKPSALTRALEWAAAQSADIIVLGEFPDVDSGDVALAPGYPHRLDTGMDDAAHFASRIVAFSRRPLVEPEIIPSTGKHHRPFLRFAVEIEAGRRLNILGAHPDAPMAPHLLRERDSTIGRLNDLARTPFVLVGDFNVTPWSPGYRAIPGLRVGPAARAPTWLMRFPLLGLPIDHIKVSQNVSASLYKVAPFLGSDHRALLARVHLHDEAK